MNSYRQNMLQKARDILSGKITGNRCDLRPCRKL
jgi:hypothetical protein